MTQVSSSGLKGDHKHSLNPNPATPSKSCVPQPPLSSVDFSLRGKTFAKLGIQKKIGKHPYSFTISSHDKTSSDPGLCNSLRGTVHNPHLSRNISFVHASTHMDIRIEKYPVQSMIMRQSMFLC
ncbi:unnamed protein product [Caretta caretta]